MYVHMICSHYQYTLYGTECLYSSMVPILRMYRNIFNLAFNTLSPSLLRPFLLTNLKKTLPLSDRTRLVALSTQFTARALCVLPTEKCFQLKPDEIRSWCRLRLGLPPSDSLTHINKCMCQTRLPFVNNPAHLHCCRTLKGTGVTLRHNRILDALASFSRQCGCSTIKEPASLASRVRTVNQVKANNPWAATFNIDEDDEDFQESNPTLTIKYSLWQPGEGKKLIKLPVVQISLSLSSGSLWIRRCLRRTPNHSYIAQPFI